MSALVRERSGIELPPARRDQLDRAVLEALETMGISNPADLCAYMAGAEGESMLDAFLGALTVGESHFFRSRVQFDALGDEILPRLIEARRGVRRLRIWSAGCATGQEPYSISILVDRLLPQIEDWDVLILATDISSAALGAARRAVYRRWSFREVPEDIERTYFVRHGQGLELVPKIRDRVTFATLNLAVDRYPSLLSNTLEIDLVLCRNVLIYFSEATARRVIDRLADSLAEGGWLVLGQAESGLANGTALTPQRIRGTLMHQKVVNHDRRVQP